MREHMRKYKRYLLAFLAVLGLYLIIEYKFHMTEAIESWGLPLVGKTVVLDAGHGGADGGALATGIVEKEVTLAITLKVRDLLSEQGVRIVMTRETDTDLANPDTQGLSRRKTEDLHKRLGIINGNNGNLYVSIHLNALEQSQYRGAQTFYNMTDESSKRFAILMQDTFQRQLQNTNRVAKPIQNIYLVKNADITGALAEVGFLSNPEERELLKDKGYQEKIAQAIADAVAAFLQGEGQEKEEG